MAERNLNFDEIVERRGTDCLKYDFAKRRGKPADVLPLWVADMDFKTSSYVEDALIERAKHGIFGYSDTQEVYFNAVAGWMERHHHWKIKEDWLIKTPGVVFALAMAVKAFTKAGDSILIQQPVYYPFSEVIRDNDRVIVSNDLILGDDNRYHIDLADFEKQIVEHDVKLFLLCNPHNPSGRVFTKEELTAMGDICVKHGVTVVSDEIHNDFVYPGYEHTVFATVDPRFAEFTVTCTAPSKTFNLAGLQISNIFIPNEKLRKAFQTEIDKTGYDEPNALGIVACEAAYRAGEDWLDQLRAYLLKNLNFLRNFLQEKIPQIHLVEPEGTYLVWLDCSELGITGEELDQFIVDKAGLWLDGGSMFGPSGAAFQRVNIACPQATLELALNKLKAAVDNLE